jgi:hypothetical protein
MLPKSVEKTSVIPITKTNKKILHKVQGCRGISLLSIPGKCLKKFVIGRLTYFLESTKQIPPQQYGFIVDRSTSDAIQTVTEFVRRNRKVESKWCLVALDIVGAFDNAWHPGILARLWELKCPKNIYNMVQDFLKDRNACIRLGEE